MRWRSGVTSSDAPSSFRTDLELVETAGLFPLLPDY